MKKLQAAMKDASAKGWRENRVMYRVGSVFKGCRNCGDVEVDDDGGERYTSGFQVFRSYDPKWHGWTWWCWECGAKDLKCWEPDEFGLIEAELGKPPLRGAREAVRERKYALRREAMKLNPRTKVDVPREPTRSEQIADLERQINELMESLKGRK